MPYDPDLPVGPDSTGHLKISPTDISQFIRLEQCMRYLRLRLHERSHGREFLTEYGVWPQEIPPLLTRSGSDFEAAVEGQVAARFPTRNLAKETPSRDRRPADNPIVVELARALPPGECLCLFQPRLVVELGDWAVRGEIDILRMERDPAGALHLLIADMKSSAAAKVEHRLQVAFYQAMLSRLFEEAGVEYAGILPAILYRGPDNEVVAQTEEDVAAIEAQREAALAVFGVGDALLEMVPDPDAYLQSVHDLVTGPGSLASRVVASPFEDLPFHLTFKCDGCIYNEFCMKWSAERDDLSLVPYLSGTEKDVLLRHGVGSVRELALLKEFSGDGGRDAGLVPAPGKEPLVRRIAATWPVGPRIDELVSRARYYRAGWKKDPIEAHPTIPTRGHGSLPYCDPDHNPNLVRVYIDAQHDYLHDRVYMLGSLVAACEGGVEKPERRHSIVHLSDGPPDTPEKEQELFVRWIDDTLRAVVELAAPDEAGEPSAPIHLIFFNSYEQRVLLDGLGRHLATILGATPLYDFVTQQAAFDSPVVTFLDAEIRELKNYPMVCQSLQAVAAFRKFDWRRDLNYREIFKERMFDFWARLDEASVPEGESAWYTSRARFKSDIPLEYAYAAWNELPAPPAPDKDDPLAPYRPVTPDILVGFERLRLEAMEHVARDFRGNRLTQKTPFRLPDLATFSDKAGSLARALQEFVAIERHVELAGWKSTRNAAPERRVLMGETLIVRYLEAEQDPEVTTLNREAERRNRLREQYEREYIASHPGAEKIKLSKEQNAEIKWSLEGRRIVLRIETAGTDANLEEALALCTLREGERVVVYPRIVTDSRLPPAERTDNTPTPKQMLYGPRGEIKSILVQRGEDGKSLSALVEVEMVSGFGGNLKGFLFSSIQREPFAEGAIYTLDSDPNDIYGYWCSVVVDALCKLQEEGASAAHALYARLTGASASGVRWDEQSAEGQARFLAGLDALHAAGAMHGFEPSKRDYIGLHGADPILLVQGPPGTGKSYSTAFAVFARMQGAMAAGRDFRVLLCCKTHAATDVLLANVRDVQRELRRLSESHPDLFARYFDPHLLDVPLFRIAGKQAGEGVTSLAKEGDRLPGEPPNADVLAANPWLIAAATPGGIYSMVKERWTNKNLIGHYLCACLVIDEASQMNLPEACMASLPLDPAGQLIVVGDPRQMPPIVKHDWAGERKRTFQQYKSYGSLFDTLLDLHPVPPMIKFAESFRLHSHIAEFLRREIYAHDGIPYHSNKSAVLDHLDFEDPFVTAVLSPQHPIVVVVHEEARSQVRNAFEMQLIGPILNALADPRLHGLDPEHGLGVVVPHRAQRADIQTAFRELNVYDPDTQALRMSAVDTVERFQGGERTAILVSATESDRDYLLASGGFLYDPRRLTVAISRAKQKMILVASRSVFSLFSPDEDAFNNAQLWKNLLRRTCTVPLWQGERHGTHVEVWGNTSSALDADLLVFK